MKKILLCCFLATGLFANSCNFWLDEMLKSQKVIFLSLEDGDFLIAKMESNNFLSSSRYAMASCPKSTHVQIEEGRVIIKNLLDSLEKRK